MVAILYWPLLLASLFFGMIGIIVCYEFLSKGDAGPAIFSFILLVPAILLLAKKKSIFEWSNNKISRAKYIIKEEIEKSEKEHAAKEAKKESEILERKISQIELEEPIKPVHLEQDEVLEEEEAYISKPLRKTTATQKPKMGASQKSINPDNIVKIESSSIRYFNLFFRLAFWLIFLLLSIIKSALVDTSKNRRKKQEKPRRPSAIQLLTPWVLELDTSRNMIRFKKRNWFFIGSDTHSFKYVNVRNIIIDEQIMTADIHIKVYAGTISAYYFTKEDAKYFRDCLLRDSDFDEELFEELEN